MMSLNIGFNQVPAPVMSSMMAVEKCISQSGLSIKLLELLRVYASQLNGCAYCIDMHIKEAQLLEETNMRLYSLPVWREVDFYSPQEQAVLALTYQVTRIGEAQFPDELTRQLSEYFSMEEQAYLTLAISQINSWHRLAKSFGFKAGSYQPGQNG